LVEYVGLAVPQFAMWESFYEKDIDY